MVYSVLTTQIDRIFPRQLFIIFTSFLPPPLPSYLHRSVARFSCILPCLLFQRNRSRRIYMQQSVACVCRQLEINNFAIR